MAINQPTASRPPRTPPVRAPLPLITVNGIVIPRPAIAAEVQNFPARNPGEGWRAAARALVVRELLRQEAVRLGIAADQTTDADGRRETLEDALLRTLVEREVSVPEADETSLKRFYDNNQARFRTPALYEADHILLAARRDDAAGFAAAQTRATLLAGVLAGAPERFESLARECSDCPSASVGGNLGQIGPGDTTPEFEAALSAAGPDTIVGPIATRYGVHIIRLRQRIEGRQLPFALVRERIASYLDSCVRHRATAQYIALLAGRADIQGISLDGASSPLVQ